MTGKINFRQRARNHFNAAKTLLESDGESELLAAALRLRMAIECLSYEVLQSFKKDINVDAMETWQPAKLIRELKNIDPGVESDRSISIAIEETPGGEAKSMQSLGTDARLTASWISKNWNALGSFLHEPTIKQIVEGKSFSPESARSVVSEVFREIERVLSATLFATNFSQNVGFQCECGFTVNRREELFRKRSGIACPNCKLIWGGEEVEGNWQIFAVFHDFSCPACKKNNKFRAKELTPATEFTCKHCNCEIVLEMDWCARRKNAL